MNSATVVTTADGSHTLLDTRLQVTYHSTHGAITESRHVFIRAGLEYCCRKTSVISILEVGFGTGLNALTTYLFACERPDLSVKYTGVEKYPIGPEVAKQLNYPELLNAEDSGDIFRQMHQDKEFSNANFQFSLHCMDIVDFPLSSQFNLIYFDAFAPSVQPEIWGVSLLEKLAACLIPGGVLVTYCAQGQFKRDLRELGFTVESLSGPPGKREMVRAIR